MVIWTIFFYIRLCELKFFRGRCKIETLCSDSESQKRSIVFLQEKANKMKKRNFNLIIAFLISLTLVFASAGTALADETTNQTEETWQEDFESGGQHDPTDFSFDDII